MDDTSCSAISYVLLGRHMNLLQLRSYVCACQTDIHCTEMCNGVEPVELSRYFGLCIQSTMVRNYPKGHWS